MLQFVKINLNKNTGMSFLNIKIKYEFQPNKFLQSTYTIHNSNQQSLLQTKIIYRYVNQFIQEKLIKKQIKIYCYPEQEQIIFQQNLQLKLENCDKVNEIGSVTFLLRDKISKEQVQRQIQNLEKIQNQFDDIKNFEDQDFKFQNSLSSSKYDIAFLYSEPIYGSRMPVTFQKQINNLKKIIKDSQMNIVFKQFIATKKNLIKVLNEGVKILHISCHGSKSNYLVFQKQSFGEAYHFSLEDFVKLFSGYEKKPDMIIINACYSSKIAEEIQKRCGIQVTIGIQSTETIQDTASEIFTKTFYASLLRTKNRFLDSFERAVEGVQNQYINEYHCCCDHDQHKVDCKKPITKNKCKIPHISICNCKQKNFHTHQSFCSQIDILYGHGLQKIETNTGKIKVCCCDAFHNQSLKFKCFYRDQSFKLIFTPKQFTLKKQQQEIKIKQNEYRIDVINILQKIFQSLKKKNLLFIQGRQLIDPAYLGQKTGYYLLQRNQCEHLQEIDLQKYDNLIEFELNYGKSRQSYQMNLDEVLQNMVNKKSILILYNADNLIETSPYQFSIFIKDQMERLKNTKILIITQKVQKSFNQKNKLGEIVQITSSSQDLINFILNIYLKNLKWNFKRQTNNNQFYRSQIEKIQKNREKQHKKLKECDYSILKIVTTGDVQRELSMLKQENIYDYLKKKINILNKENSKYVQEYKQLRKITTQTKDLFNSIVVLSHFKNRFNQDDIQSICRFGLLKIKSQDIRDYLQKKPDFYEKKSEFYEKKEKIYYKFSKNWLQFLRQKILKEQKLINNVDTTQKFVQYYHHRTKTILAKLSDMHDHDILDFSPFHRVKKGNLVQEKQSFKDQQKNSDFLNSIYDIKLIKYNKRFVLNLKESLLTTCIIAKLLFQQQYLQFIKKSFKHLHIIFTESRQYVYSKVKFLYMYCSSLCKMNKNAATKIDFDHIFDVFSKYLKIYSRLIGHQEIKVDTLLLEVLCLKFKLKEKCRSNLPKQSKNQFKKEIKVIRQKIFNVLTKIAIEQSQMQKQQNLQIYKSRINEIYKYIAKIFLKLIRNKKINEDKNMIIIKFENHLKIGFKKIIEKLENLKDKYKQQNWEYKSILELLFKIKFEQMKYLNQSDIQKYAKLKCEIQAELKDKLRKKKIIKLIQEIQNQITKKSEHLLVFLSANPLVIENQVSNPFNFMQKHYNIQFEIIEIIKQKNKQLYLSFSNLTQRNLKKVLDNGCFLLYLNFNAKRNNLIFQSKSTSQIFGNSLEGEYVNCTYFDDKDFDKVKILVISGYNVLESAKSLKKKKKKTKFISINVDKDSSCQLSQLEQQIRVKEIYEIASRQFIKYFTKNLIQIHSFEDCFQIAKHHTLISIICHKKNFKIYKEEDLEKYLTIQIIQSEERDQLNDQIEIKNEFENGDYILMSQKKYIQSKKKFAEFQNSLCIGRNQFIFQILKEITDSKMKIVVVQGQSGIGKSTIIYEVYYQLLKYQFFQNIYYYNKVAAQNKQDENLNNDTLVIIDVVDQHYQKKMIQYLAKGCKILTTNTKIYQLIDEKKDFFKIIQIKEIGKRQASLLLLSFLPLFEMDNQHIANLYRDKIKTIITRQKKLIPREIINQFKSNVKLIKKRIQNEQKNKHHKHKHEKLKTDEKKKKQRKNQKKKKKYEKKQSIQQKNYPILLPESNKPNSCYDISSYQRSTSHKKQQQNLSEESNNSRDQFQEYDQYNE